MKLSSFNVNSLRAILKKGTFAQDMARLDADVMGFEETKLSDDNPLLFPYRPQGYGLFQTISKVKKGYSGVAVLSRVAPLSVHYGLLAGKYDDEGRAVTLEFGNFYYVVLYVPNSGEGLKRLDFRLGFQKDLQAYLATLQHTKPVVVTGDLNVAKEEIDIKNPASNHLNAGFTDQERQAMRDLLAACGLVDCFRLLHPTEVAYTWWSYRFHARAHNAGWRIDSFLASQALVPYVRDCAIHGDILGSDHCPITLELDF